MSWLSYGMFQFPVYMYLLQSFTVGNKMPVEVQYFKESEAATN